MFEEMNHIVGKFFKAIDETAEKLKEKAENEKNKMSR